MTSIVGIVDRGHFGNTWASEETHEHRLGNHCEMSRGIAVVAGIVGNYKDMLGIAKVSRALRGIAGLPRE